MGGYLDRKKILTRDFFSNYDLFDDNLLTKFQFGKKMEIIIGMYPHHVESIFN
jgi:hypothetical protein